MGWRRRSREEWQWLVSDWPRSGLTQGVYCAQHGISVGSLQRWRRLLDAEAATPRTEGSAATEFVPVTLVGDPPAAAGADLTLVLADGVRLEIGTACPAETLKRVLGVLRECA